MEVAQAHVALCESEAERERREAEEAKEDLAWEEAESAAASEEQALSAGLEKVKKKAAAVNSILLKVQTAMLKDPRNENHRKESEELQGEG